MGDNDVIGLDDHLEISLEGIRQVLTREIPPYILSRRQTFQLGPSDTDFVCYKVLNCHFTSLLSSKSVGNMTFDTYRAEIEMEESRSIKLDGEESREVVIKETLIVKTIKGNSGSRDMYDSKRLFYVESKMFSDIIPLLLSSPFTAAYYNRESSSNLCKSHLLFPKCYYSCRKFKDSLIVLEDIQQSGCKLVRNNSQFMDFNHIVLALEGLARFHALSYAMKKKDPQSFFSRVVQEVVPGKKYRAEDKGKEKLYAYAYLKTLQFAALQPLEMFAVKYRNTDDKYDSGAERLKTLLQDTVGVIRELLIPKEPLAVLCHGNFNINNILFRYDTDEKPTEVKFMDFQNAHYASPAIDLSLFLFLNASPELRAERRVQLFSAYHLTLLKSMSEFMDCAEEELLPEYSIEAFKEEFSRHAVYGYILTAGFVASAPSKRIHIHKIFEMFNDGLPLRENIDKSIRENLKLEGEEVTYRLVLLIKEMVDEGYL